MLGSAHTPVDTKQLSEQRTNEAPSHKPVLGAVPCQQVDAPYPSDKELSLVHCPAPHSNLLQPCSIYLYRNFKAKGQSLNIQGVSPSAGKGTHKQTRARTHTHTDSGIHARTHTHSTHTRTDDHTRDAVIPCHVCSNIWVFGLLNVRRLRGSSNMSIGSKQLFEVEQQ